MHAVPWKRRILLVLCSLLLSAQVTGAHLHLCLDGQEPPVQLHVAGATETHDESKFSLPHSDREIALTRNASTPGKFFPLDLPPAIDCTTAHELQLPADSPTPACADHPSFRTAPHELLPPSRGPPHLA